MSKRSTQKEIISQTDLDLVSLSSKTYVFISIRVLLVLEILTKYFFHVHISYVLYRLMLNFANHNAEETELTMIPGNPYQGRAPDKSVY